MRNMKQNVISTMLVCFSLCVPGAVQADDSKKIPVSVRASSPAGVAVRVKGIEIGGDVTTVDVHMTYSGFHSAIKLAGFRGNTFMEDDEGMRLPLRAPKDNEKLEIKRDDVLQGQLVFLGHVPTSARKVRLVFNADHEKDDGLWPKIELDIPLQKETP